jgi:hypothetical protein
LLALLLNPRRFLLHSRALLQLDLAPASTRLGFPDFVLLAVHALLLDPRSFSFGRLALALLTLALEARGLQGSLACCFRFGHLPLRLQTCGFRQLDFTPAHLLCLGCFLLFLTDALEVESFSEFRFPQSGILDVAGLLFIERTLQSQALRLDDSGRGFSGDSPFGIHLHSLIGRPWQLLLTKLFRRGEVSSALLHRRGQLLLLFRNRTEARDAGPGGSCCIGRAENGSTERRLRGKWRAERRDVTLQSSVDGRRCTRK